MPVVFALVAALVVIAWYELSGRLKALKELRANCNHQWSEPYSAYNEGKMWQHKCPACGEFENCYADGTKLPVGCWCQSPNPPYNPLCKVHGEQRP